MNQGPWLPRLSTKLKIQMIAGEAVILDRANERVHQLNEVGSFILQCCDGTRTRDDIVSALVNRYDVDDAEAEADTVEILTRMKALEILI